MPPVRAERKRRLVSEELRETALQLLAARGYEETTAGISRRTFHRYYASKEDVVIQLLADLGDEMRTELESRPPAEPPAESLRHAVTVAINFCAGHHDAAKTLAVVRLIHRTPVLHARSLERQARWQAELAQVRRGDLAGNPTPSIRRWPPGWPSPRSPRPWSAGPPPTARPTRSS